MLDGTIEGAPDGTLGFDIDEPVSSDRTRSFHERGYRFCLRYVGREEMATGHDLSTEEAKRLLNAGLALMPVQHVERGYWTPTADMGARYGANAARFVRQLGFPDGVNVWLDLECVEAHVPGEVVIAYCNNWFDEVAAAGYRPGVYVGYQPILSGAELRKRLKFKHYWAAYNVDVSIPGRGWQMQQKDLQLLHQNDRVHVDEQGDRVHWLQPAGWAPAPGD